MSTPSLQRPVALALACCLNLNAAQASLVENFESYAPGSFPAAAWLDAASFQPTPPGYPAVSVPSARVVSTGDALGQATQALQLADALGSARGIYTVDGVAPLKTVQSDVRVLRYSNGDPAVAPAWLDTPFSLGFMAANPGASPFANLYISSSTRSWHLFYDGVFAADPSGIDDYDLGLAADLERWYTASLSYDTVHRSLRAQVNDTASGQVLRISTFQYADNGLVDLFDATMAWGLEGSATLPPQPGQATLANIAQFDNIFITGNRVPEPASAALVLAALLALVSAPRRRTRRRQD